MPVRVEADSVELKTSDSISTFATAGSSRVVPVLIGPTASELTANASHLKLDVLQEDEKLIAISRSVEESEARPIFGDARVVALPLDDAIYTSPPAAWQTLDGIMFDTAEAAKLDDGRRSALLAGGLTLAVNALDKPDSRWPWARRGNLWILHSNPLGPGDGIINPDAFGPISAIPPGSSSRDRRTLVAVALVLLAMLIAARFVRWPLRYLAGVAVLTIAFAIGWRHVRAAVAIGQGDIVVQSGTLQRKDSWRYEVGRTERVHSVPWSGFTRPVLPSESVLQESQLKLVDDGSLCFEYRAAPSRGVAFMRSDVTATIAIASGNVSSPMRVLATDVYVQPGISIAGAHANATGWPDVLLDDKR